MKVLVTGASGFIGRHVVAHLSRDPTATVTAVSRRWEGALPVGVTHLPADLLAPGAAEAVIERIRPTHLIHLGWDARPGIFWTSPDNLRWSAASTILLTEFAAKGGVRVVGAGTCAEYDWNTGIGRLDEQAATAPSTLYGAAKDATRRLWLAASHHLDVSVAWGRVFWLYGPNEAAGRLVSDICRTLIDGSPFPSTEGRQRRDFMHVDDVAGAFVAALNSDWRGSFNIGAGRAYPVRDIITALADALGRPDLPRLGVRETPANDPPLIEADTHVLNERIGFRPAISLEQGMADTAAWWRHHYHGPLTAVLHRQG